MRIKGFLRTVFVLLSAMSVPATVAAADVTYELVAEGVYMSGNTCYVCSGVTSLAGVHINAGDIYCFAPIPPSCDDATFEDYSATVHVTAEAVAAYSSALHWKDFAGHSGDAREPLSLRMSKSSVVVELGDLFSLQAIPTPTGSTPYQSQWSTTDNSVVQLRSSSSGYSRSFLAVGVGECDIIASCLDRQAVCHVTVPQRFTVELDRHRLSLRPNQRFTLTHTCIPYETEVVVTSNNPDVAVARLVDGRVEITGIAEGTAQITVKPADGKGTSDKCVVDVYTEHGDLTCDGSIDVSDVTALISVVLGSEPAEGIKPANGDMNGDQAFDVTDVTQLIAAVLGSYRPATRTFRVCGVEFTMVAVEGGTFTMGTDDSDAAESQKPAHEVTLTGYYIGQTEVTQALWEAVMKPEPGASNQPVYQMTWDRCQDFIAKLNELTGERFRLPTEAEWEFAARGGNLSHGYIYAGSDSYDEVAWCGENTDGNYMHIVATKAPNELGLYDMSGNVDEWCQDWYGPYSAEPQTNPTGPQSGTERVIRGGSVIHASNVCKVSLHRRHSIDPGGFVYECGLRLAL